MSAEATKSVVINKEAAPEGLAQVDKAEIRPGEGLVLIAGENERKVRHVGEFAVDLMVEAGFAVEQSPASPIEIELRNELAEIREMLVAEREDHKTQISALKRAHSEELKTIREDNAALIEGFQTAIGELRTSFDELKAQLDSKPTEDKTPDIDALETQLKDGLTLAELAQLSKDYSSFRTDSINDEAFSAKLGQDRLKLFDEALRKDYIKGYLDSLPEDKRRKLPADAPEILDRYLVIKIAENKRGPAPVESPPPPVESPPPAERRGTLVRPSFLRRTRYRLPGSPEPEEFYRDDLGYYTIVDGREVPVTEREAVGPSVGGVALVGAVVGIAAWELIVEKVFGFGDGSSHQLKEVIHNQSTVIHNQGVEIQGLQKANANLTTVKHYLQHAHDHDRRMIHGLHNQIHRVAVHDNRLIEGLKGEIARDHAQEMRKIGNVHDHLQNSGAYWGFRYPWDWAASKVGSLRAEPWLHRLAARAAEHGHKVRWILNGNGKEILQVDGTTNSQKVINIVSQYSQR